MQCVCSSLPANEDEKTIYKGPSTYIHTFVSVCCVCELMMGSTGCPGQTLPPASSLAPPFSQVESLPGQKHQSCPDQPCSQLLQASLRCPASKVYVRSWAT